MESKSDKNKRFVNGISRKILVFYFVLPGLNGGYWDAIGVRGVVREKIQKQESLESAEKEKANSKSEQKKQNKERRSLSKDSPRKRHRTLSSGKQETETSNTTRNKKSPTPPRRLKSLDTDPATSKTAKTPLRQSRSLENCNISNPWVVVENAGLEARLDKKSITETWVHTSPSHPVDSTAFIGEILDDLLMGLQLFSQTSQTMIEAEGQQGASSLTEENENKDLGERSPKLSRRKSPVNDISPALDSNSLEKEITESPKSEMIKPRSLRRRSSAVLVSKSTEESSMKEDLTVVSPRSLRRRSQVEESPSAKESREDKHVSPSLQLTTEECGLVAESKTSNEDNAVEESIPKPEIGVQEKIPLHKTLDEKMKDGESSHPMDHALSCMTSSVEINNTQPTKVNDRKEEDPSSISEDRVSKKRGPLENNSSAKRQRVDPEEAVSDVDPICEDFEAYPVHFDEGFLGAAEENFSAGEVTSDSTWPKDKKSQSGPGEKTVMTGEEKSSEPNGSKSDGTEERDPKLDKSGEKKSKVCHQRIVTRKRSVESPWISSNGEQKSRRRVDNVKEASKTEKENDSKKEDSPSRSVTTEEEEGTNPQTISHAVSETEEKTISSEEKKTKARKYPKNTWMTRKAKDDCQSREKEKAEEEKREHQVFEFEEEPEDNVDPPIGRILELVVNDDDLKEKPCLEKDSGNGSERDEDDTVIEDLVDMDYMNISKDSVGENSDIWSSINEALMDVSKSTSNKEEEHDEETKSPEKKDDLDFDLGSSKKGGFDWPEGLAELKDEFADDNNDIWASTNEMMNQISMSLDVSPLQPKADQKSHERSPSRKSRSKKRRAEENLGNPDSGKENADTDVVEGDIVVESKKIEKVLSPVTKRKKDPRPKPPKSSERKSPLPSSPTPKRQRSLSGSSDESCEESRQLGEKSTKPGEVVRLASGNHRTIQIIEPIPLVNPSDSSSSDKTSTRTKASPRKVKEVHQNRERTKPERISQTETRRKEESNSSKSKSSKKPSTSKSKQDWSLKSLTKTHPSSLVKYYDNEYDRLTNKPETSKSRRPSK